MKMLHEKETTNLRRERDILINKNQAGGSTEAQSKRTLARDTAHLKGLLSLSSMKCGLRMNTRGRSRTM